MSRPLPSEDLAFPHSGGGRKNQERLELQISFFLADADHCNDFFGFRKAIPAWRFLLLRDDAHGVLVVLLEANGIVEDAAEDGPALVDARCCEAFLSQVRKKVSHCVRM